MPPPQANQHGSIHDADDLRALVETIRTLFPYEVTIESRSDLAREHFLICIVPTKPPRIIIVAGDAAYEALTAGAWERLAERMAA